MIMHSPDFPFWQHGSLTFIESILLSWQARITSDSQDLSKTHDDSKKKREKVILAFNSLFSDVGFTLEDIDAYL